MSRNCNLCRKAILSFSRSVAAKLVKSIVYVAIKHGKTNIKFRTETYSHVAAAKRSGIASIVFLLQNRPAQPAGIVSPTPAPRYIDHGARTEYCAARKIANRHDLRLVRSNSYKNAVIASPFRSSKSERNCLMVSVFWMKFVFVIVTAGIGFLWYRARPGRHGATKYARRKPLNYEEQTLYWRLAKTLPGHVILAQVSMTRCVGACGPDYEIVARENIDFVVCDHRMHIVAAIELEDETRPASEYRKMARRVKAEALAAAGIRLIKCSRHRLLSEAYIEMEFNQHTTLQTHLVA